MHESINGISCFVDLMPDWFVDRLEMFNVKFIQYEQNKYDFG